MLRVSSSRASSSPGGAPLRSPPTGGGDCLWLWLGADNVNSKSKTRARPDFRVTKFLTASGNTERLQLSMVAAKHPTRFKSKSQNRSSGFLVFSSEKLRLQRAHVGQELAVSFGLAQLVDQQFHGFNRRQ